MSEAQNDDAKPDVIPEHESPVRRIMTNAKGGDYAAFHSLNEAQRDSDGAVIFEGDYGGIVYLTCPARLIRCSSDALDRLLLDLDALVFAYPPSAKVYYEQAKPGQGILGGSGGGVVVDGLWIHRYLHVLHLEEDIKAVLKAERPRLSGSTEELLKRGKAAEPTVARWPRRLAELYQSWARAAVASDRAAFAAKSLAEHETALGLSKRISGRWLSDVAEMALEASEDAKADHYAQRIVREAWQAIAQAHYWPFYGEGIYRASIIMGKIALRAGDIKKAKHHLIEAAKSPWKADRHSKLPDTALAKSLLEEGERDVVVEYLRLCRFIWKEQEEHLLELSQSLNPVPEPRP